MPQELHVVCCCSCTTFQSDIIKKVPKWTCKMCNEKQSLQKVYFIGSGKECRKVTQELNMRKFVHKNLQPSTEIKQESNELDVDCQIEVPLTESEVLEPSKWNQVLEMYKEVEDDVNCKLFEPKVELSEATCLQRS